MKSSRVETVEWDGTRDVTITWENVRDISLTIIKVDEQTGVSLRDATFDVYADGKLITSVTTNDSGVARVTGIRKEAYIEVVETAAPAGYVLDKTSHGIHIDPYDPAIEDDPVLTITNKARPALRMNLAKVLGAGARRDGYTEGNGWLVSWCVGHLVDLANADAYDPRYSKWA